MSSNDRTCKGTNAEGEPCASPVVGKDGYCPAHRPGGSEEMSRRGTKGAYVTQERKGSRLTAEELGPLKTYDDVARWLEKISLALATGRLETKRGNSLARNIRTLLDCMAEQKTSMVVDELQDEVDRLRDELEGRGTEAQPWR